MDKTTFQICAKVHLQPPCYPIVSKAFKTLSVFSLFSNPSICCIATCFPKISEITIACLSSGMFRSCNFALIFYLKCNTQSKCTGLGKTYLNAPKRACLPKCWRFDKAVKELEIYLYCILDLYSIWKTFKFEMFCGKLLMMDQNACDKLIQYSFWKLG